LNCDQYVASWHLRYADLSAHAGKTVQDVQIVNDACSPAGSFWATFTDIAIGSTDGSVRPIYNRQKAMTLSVSCDAGVSDCWQIIGHPNGIGWAYHTTTTYYHGDHLGSSRFLSSYNGTPMAEATFRPFGEEHNPQMGVNHYKFTDLERDTESALDHTWFRKYAPTSARWLSPDPVRGEMSNPQRLNLYSYALNDPANLVDPLGADPVATDPILPMESGQAMNTIGLGGCVPCQFTGDMLFHWINRFALAAADDIIQRVLNDAGDRAVFLWTSTGNGYEVTGLNQAAGAAMTFGFLTITYGSNAPAMTGRLQAYILDVMLGSGTRAIRVSATTNGAHSANSWHYSGQAVDIDMVNGHVVRTFLDNSSLYGQISLIQHTANNSSIGVARENYGPAGLWKVGVMLDPGQNWSLFTQHQNHIHLTVPDPVRP
jgi:RHS repeat-associated protein